MKEVPARVAAAIAPTASLMAPKPRATGGTLIRATAVRTVTKSPTAAWRNDTAPRFSPNAQAMASSARTPNDDCN